MIVMKEKLYNEVFTLYTSIQTYFILLAHIYLNVINEYQ